jgi:carboxyl-terminal processing protease
MKRNENLQINFLSLVLFGSLLLSLVGCTQEGATIVKPSTIPENTATVTSVDTPEPQPTTTSTVVPNVAPNISPEKLAEHQEVFEIVWQTVNERFFDLDFNGVDWEDIYDQYLPKINAARDEEEFYILLNKMCFELRVSHIAVVPPDSNALEPILSSQGSAGIDLRLIDDQAVITAIQAGSPADQAGLRPGYVILSLDGISVENGEKLVELKVPPFNQRKLRGQALNAILTKFYGEPGQKISLSYLDEENINHEATLVIEERAGEPFAAEGLQPMYVGFEAKRLESGIAYIQLDGFLPPILEGVLGAIQEMRDAPGMIIDIRGNPGGFYPVRKAIASQFFQERTLLWRYITRPGLELPDFEHEGYSDPPAEPYLGPVVVLVDVLSGSSSEEFAGAIQANQRATILGERTSGSDLVADILVLPNGATFLYPIAQTQTADGTVLEDRGVIPDIPVALDREDLLQGIDSQLQAAIQYLEREMSPDDNE